MNRPVSVLLRCLRVSSPRPQRHTLGRGALLAGSLAVLAFAGCTNPPEPAIAAQSTKYTLENTDRFVVLNHMGASPVTCTGLMDHMVADGRMEVVANLKNRENRAVTLQAGCVFRDASGENELEETAWQNVSIPADTTEAVRFTASSPDAKSYTIRVRNIR